MPTDSHQIFKATYSGIPVYEMIVKGVAVMRRRSDSWLNATQILKVAGFDKPQRTRVLEREVQKGEHEKVQGGYGKYQGTWIPLSRGLELAKQYNCEPQLRPIIDFQPAAKSPPPAPKHIVAASSVKKGKPIPPDAIIVDDSDIDMIHNSDSDISRSPTPSLQSSSSRSPSPVQHSPPARRRASPKRKVPRRAAAAAAREPTSDGETSAVNGTGKPRPYGDQILEYFISDSNQVPPILMNPPADFDPNMPIDDEAHTALHWACAMGRVRVVKYLLQTGADIFKVNKTGQTALMRSVMFANNYDVRKFPELYEMLHRSTLNIDNFNRTVFHHIVDVAMTKGKAHAARYYLETVLERLADYPRELADIINFQDEDGETALTMAARCRSKRLVKILIDHGADPKIANRDGKSTEDYILEDERFQASPVVSNRALSMSLRDAQPGASISTYALGSAGGPEKSALRYSSAAQRASTRCVADMASMLDSLATSYDRELRDKDRDLNQAHALLANIQAEILESQRTVGSLRASAQGVEEIVAVQHQLQGELNAKVARSAGLGWQKWLTDEEKREADVRSAGNGVLVPPLRLVTGEDGVQRAEQEDIDDMIALHSNIPTDPAALQQECEALRQELSQRRERRVQLMHEYVRARVEAGTEGRMQEYKMLLADGMGGRTLMLNEPGAENDEILRFLEQLMEAEEPSSGAPSYQAGQIATGR
ncbi:unnamed protein product [Peniophora sp. CBMAI 1063]|nr:unnamed protein product [Peniophora sp. CBMAI 1063]